MPKVLQTMLIIVGMTAAGIQSFSQTPTLINSKNKAGKMNTLQSTSNKQAIRDLYEHILNQRNLELLSDVIDSSYIGIRGEKGTEGFKQTVGSLIDAFPDITWNVEDLLADENKVVIRWKWTGTFKNPFRGIPANQKEFSNEGISIYELKNSKAVKSWMQSDLLGFLVQADIISPSILPGAPSKK